MDATTLPANPPARPASLEEAKREAQRLKFSTVGELGWAPKLSIREGILRTLAYLRANPWLLESR